MHKQRYCQNSKRLELSDSHDFGLKVARSGVCADDGRDNAVNDVGRSGSTAVLALDRLADPLDLVAFLLRCLGRCSCAMRACGRDGAARVFPLEGESNKMRGEKNTQPAQIHCVPSSSLSCGRRRKVCLCAGPNALRTEQREKREETRKVKTHKKKPNERKRYLQSPLAVRAVPRMP